MSRTSLVTTFASHRVACNLLMALMVLAGAAALARLNTQTFPNAELATIGIRVVWSGAAAQDVAAAVTRPIERALSSLGAVSRITSTSTHGAASIVVKYEEGADMAAALDEVKERVASIRNLPADADEPVIRRSVRSEKVARLLVTGDEPRSLRPIVRRIERELIERGIDRIEIAGLPREEMAVEVPSAVLRELDMSILDVARRISALSLDLPAGTIGRDEASKQLRVLDQRRRETGFEGLALRSGDDGTYLVLGDAANIERRPRRGEIHVSVDGRPTVTLEIRRTRSSDSLESARIVREWLEAQRGRWPPGVEVIVYDEAWEEIRDQIRLLAGNGASGFVLVVVVLFLFLEGRVAFWVAAGIPVSFMAALAVLYAVGGTINTISMFAFILALGIIVDDAVVVGEEAFARRRAGAGPLEAAQGGAHRMLGPVLSSSLTTVAAFLPLMLVGGFTGTMMLEVPLVVICVVLASLIECFLILPGHLHHAFRRTGARAPGRARRGLDRGFERLRDRIFRPLVTAAAGRPWTTLSCAIAALLLTVGLVGGGRLAFSFFPSPETSSLAASVHFVAGTPPQRVERFMTHLERTLRETEAHFGEALIVAAVTYLGAAGGGDGQGSARGDQFAELRVQLVESDRRATRNEEFVAAWRERMGSAPGLESILVVETRVGPPGRDIAIGLNGGDADTLKAAAVELASVLAAVAGVSGVRDDLPFGQEQLVWRLTPQARALGLTATDAGEQLRGAYDGRVAQIFQDQGEEIEVRVVLPDEERHDLASLGNLSIALPGGGTMPLLTALAFERRQGFDILRHRDGRLSLVVSASVDRTVTSPAAVLSDLLEGPLPEILARYGVERTAGSRSADRSRTLNDMQWGAGLALALIYVVLAFVFASWGWPLVVMAAIPFGFIGAALGHWLLGIDLTVVSLIGLFGLSGIVVNDSIILLTTYKALKESGTPWREAIVEAACRRLRAVLLTSLTTIGGLTPLLFETSLQAQLLTPMAVSIAFGLGVATFLVLLLVPALLALHEAMATRWEGRATAGVRAPD